jgi:hypothetical protein
MYKGVEGSLLDIGEGESFPVKYRVINPPSLEKVEDIQNDTYAITTNLLSTE